MPGIKSHEWHAVITPTSSIAHKGMVVGAKVIAVSILDLLTTPDLLATVHAEFVQATPESQCFPMLPADVKLPLDLNREAIAKYRLAMSRVYLQSQPRLQ